MNTLIIRGIALAALFSAALTTPALAHENYFGGWLTAALKGPIGNAEESSWQYLLHGEYRAYDEFDGIRYSVMRVGAIYSLDNGFSVSGGYGRHHTRLVAGGSVTENRTWQAVEWKHRLDNDWVFSARTRLEQRFFDGADGARWRLRQNVKLQIPFQQHENLDWIFSVEPFFQVYNPRGNDGRIGQIRSFAGINVKTGGKSRVEVGYLNQWGRVRNGEDLVNHMLQVNLRFSQ